MGILCDSRGLVSKINVKIAPRKSGFWQKYGKEINAKIGLKYDSLFVEEIDNFC